MIKTLPRHNDLDEALNLLSRLIAVPSFSDEETASADIWEEWLNGKGAGKVERFHNNVFVVAD